MGIAITPCPCPAVTLAQGATTVNSLEVQVTSGGPVKLTLGMVGGTQYEQHGDGPFVFEDLQPDTVYSAVAVNQCGETATLQVQTAACPPALATFTSTTHTITATVTQGAPAEVTLGGLTKQVANNGGAATFEGLAPGTEYTVRVDTECGVGAWFAHATQECPALSVTTNSTTSAITATVAAGGPAKLSLGSQAATVPTGGAATFTGLPPGTDFTIIATRECDGREFQVAATTQPCPVVSATHTATTDSITVTIAGGAPARVTLGDASKDIDANGGTAEFLGLDAGTEYTVQVQSECGNDEVFNFATLPCPAVTADISSVTTSGFTITPTAGYPVDVQVLDAAGRVLDSEDGVGATGHTVMGLPDGQRVRVVATNDCGSVWRTQVDIPVEPRYCPSYELPRGGFAFIAGDAVDPEATVVVAPNGFVHPEYRIYPTPRPGATAQVLSTPEIEPTTTVLGYAANSSDCAFARCCDC